MKPSSEPNPVSLTPEALTIVREIVARLAHRCEVFVFGSRAGGRVDRRSDLDLAFRGPEPLTFREAAALRDAFQVSNLDYRVDVVDLHAITPEFRAIVEAQMVPLP